MKTFTDYFHDSQREYKYTVKIACNDITEEMISDIEEQLGRLDISSMTTFKRTPIQENPLDFPNINNTSVHIADCVVRYPSSTDMLERVISEATGLQRNCVVVYTENDPRKVYTQQYLERMANQDSKDYVPVTGLEPQSSEHGETPKYGEAHVEEFMNTYKKKQKERQEETVEVTNKLIPNRKIELPDNYNKDMGPIGTQSPFSKETRTK